MGGGIAMNFLNSGIPVKILEIKEEACVGVLLGIVFLSHMDAKQRA